MTNTLSSFWAQPSLKYQRRRLVPAVPSLPCYLPIHEKSSGAALTKIVS